MKFKSFMLILVLITVIAVVSAGALEALPFGKTTSEPVTISVVGDGLGDNRYCNIAFVNHAGRTVATYGGACYLWRDKKTATFKTWKGALSGETRSGIYNIE